MEESKALLFCVTRVLSVLSVGLLDYQGYTFLQSIIYEAAIFPYSYSLPSIGYLIYLCLFHGRMSVWASSFPVSDVLHQHLKISVIRTISAS